MLQNVAHTETDHDDHNMKSIQTDATQRPTDILSIELSGFKSLARKTKVNFSALTILSGANSSGKTSVSQAILLLKQTSESQYDPGALLLNGPNVKLTSATQLLSRLPDVSANKFTIRFNYRQSTFAEISYKYAPEKPGGFDINYIKRGNPESSVRVSMNSKSEELAEAALIDLPPEVRNLYPNIFKAASYKVERNKCFYNVVGMHDYKGTLVRAMETPFGLSNDFLQQLIHVPGLRGNPERTYATTATSLGKFPGRFESYVASLIRSWELGDPERFARLTQSLIALGLTSSIKTQKIDDTQVEIRVSRFKNAPVTSGEEHLVSIADVGFGVSQVLPILVALIVAVPGQYVIIEQPELHLHPKAQSALSSVFAEAIRCGVRIIVETHSNILILGIQTRIACGDIPSGSVSLNWFATNSDGYSKVSVGSFDQIGAFGNWPSDFMDTQLQSENDYLNAVERKIYSESSNEK